MNIHEFVGPTVTHLAEELVQYKAVRINFNYNPSKYNVEDIAKRAYLEIKNKLKQPVKEVKLFQLNNPNREYDSWVYTLSAPSNNREAKHYLSDSFV